MLLYENQTQGKMGMVGDGNAEKGWITFGFCSGMFVMEDQVEAGSKPSSSGFIISPAMQTSRSQFPVLVACQWSQTRS